MGKPSAPTPPDPKETAAAATGTSVGTAIANTNMQNVGQVTPYGSLSYSQTGTNTFTDPYTGMTYDIPQFTSTTTLSPEQQALYNQTTASQQALGAAGMTAAQGFTPTQAAVPGYDPFKTSVPLQRNAGLQDQAGLSSTAGLQTSAGLNTTFGAEDFSADRNEYEAALMARMQPQLDNQQQALNASLANQGIGYGAEAFNDAQFTQSQAQNDAYMAAILAAGQEQQRMFDMQMNAQLAGNAALQQEYSNFNNPTQQEFMNANSAAQQEFQNFNNTQQQNLNNFNTAQQQGFNNFNSGTAANNQNASTAFNQSIQSQNDYMNQIMSLLNAGQPMVPQFQPNTPTPIPTTDTAGIINNNYNQEQQAYQQQMASWNSMWGNLFGLGGDVVGAI
jgi:hypothetical protein